ncbi:5-oxoprolinase subunit PxpB [uncultured Polaribacter sp.]|uniref:5-oxoprolinase subunit PxpB n=1 Tax=uncultured Polaribacter sp. TaxID=174711 RepID=UPI00261EA778|nr:5-oxoprolinase subunit PxpB [uncultured Polaribacter sp.]
MPIKITYKLYGEKAILIEWQKEISTKISEDILMFASKIETKKDINIVDVIAAYNSLTIIFKDNILDFEKEIHQLKTIYNSTVKTFKKENFIWEIPVCYDLQFGIDLQEMEKKSGLSISEIVKLHSEKLYRVYFIGFLPGFLYLGGLNKQLFFDRKANPRLKVAKGAIAIGGNQTGVYPTETAGGWNIIGNSPVDFFDISKENPCFAKPGDFINFKAISLLEYQHIKNSIYKKTYTLSKYPVK